MTDLGLSLSGGMLQRLPPSANKDDQTSTLNNIVDQLNGWNGVIVQQGTVNVQPTGAFQDVFYLPHNLTYAPTPFAFLNGVGVGLLPGKRLNVPLPTILSATFLTNVGTEAATIFARTAEIQCMCDETNLYIYIFNATGSTLTTKGYDITYYLTRLNAKK